jgi:acetylornithine deacetylase/succinyl-diaminopimelate desuccinylase-like protein
MIGRGATDMKCATASFIVAVETLRKLGVRLKGDVIVQSVIGEEAVSRELAAPSSAATRVTSRSSASRLAAATSSPASGS